MTKLGIGRFFPAQWRAPARFLLSKVNDVKREVGDPAFMGRENGGFFNRFLFLFEINAFKLPFFLFLFCFFLLSFAAHYSKTTRIGKNGTAGGRAAFPITPVT